MLRSAGVDITVTGSLGVVRTADPHLDPGELLRRADVALYDAKRAGRNRFEMFDAEAHLGSESTAGLAAELTLALERSELFALYQPLIRLNDGALVGAEVLVRWRHPQRGVLLPGDFIAHAERRGLIEKIDSFVLDEACRQRRSARPRGGPNRADSAPEPPHLPGRSRSRSCASRQSVSEPEFANACLVEAEVVTNLVTHRLDDLQPEALGIIPEVAYKCVAKNQDLVWQATAPEERHATQLGADVHAVRVVLGTAVGNDDRYVLQYTLELDRQLVQR